jgi:tetratricopeptide (TPR) repeat protein
LVAPLRTGVRYRFRSGRGRSSRTRRSPLLEGDVDGAIEACRTAVELGRACGEATVTSRALGLVGFGALVAGDLPRADELLLQAERAAQGAPWATAWALYFRSAAALAAARWRLAAELAQQAAGLIGPNGDAELFAWIGLNRAQALQRMGEERQAVCLLEEAITTFGRLRMPRGTMFALIPCSVVLADQRRPKAACLLAAADALRIATGTTTAPFIRNWVEEAIARLRDALTPDEVAGEWLRGQELSVDEAVNTALVELAAVRRSAGWERRAGGG